MFAGCFGVNECNLKRLAVRTRGFIRSILTRCHWYSHAIAARQPATRHRLHTGDPCSVANLRQKTRRQKTHLLTPIQTALQALSLTEFDVR